MIDAGRAHAGRGQGLHDRDRRRDGVLKAFSRMDGAPLVSIQVAQDKAYTAVGFGMPTAAGTTSSRTTRRSPPARPTASTAS